MASDENFLVGLFFALGLPQESGHASGKRVCPKFLFTNRGYKS